MKPALPAAVVISFGLMSSPVGAQNLYESCAYDISYHCAEVAPGDGRIASCLYAHTATLTDACYAATDGVSRLMETFFDRLGTLKEVCTQDVATHCASEEIGDGRILQCLSDTKAISKNCSASLSSVGLTPAE